MYTIESKYTTMILILLLLVAAMPRFYNLNALGFYGDEETSSFAARSLAQGNGMVMPSGMPYLRSMPLTVMNALSAKAFGPEKEFAYRLPAAIIGTITVPLLFLVARPFVGAATALLAALLLAFSEWHIITSREARMYAPFLFFYIVTAFALLQWNLGNKLRYALAAFALFASTATLHPLGIIAVQFAAIPIAFPNWSRLKLLPIIIF
ncbi:MAG: phospholipid carrier-dependent glycosyltransferase, partial [Gammaproteobacteria bacterium]|nr:phospholipid carrier-dependent glycosyltransferase [Gammaproteobacteria bacterium]